LSSGVKSYLFAIRLVMAQTDIRFEIERHTEYNASHHSSHVLNRPRAGFVLYACFTISPYHQSEHQPSLSPVART
jgi:hypothetical protein